jgi:NAD(P)-dependent dehydrogenase (short-subunit alcohol dehydrogenase family)
MTDLKGKVAVVTGASKGIGAAIAKRVGEAGASVVVNYSSSRKDTDQIVADIRANGGKDIAIKGDVAKAAGVTPVSGTRPRRESFGLAAAGPPSSGDCIDLSPEKSSKKG